jgi:pimeloyl-ACP methyl ester carboxylesterase
MRLNLETSSLERQYSSRYNKTNANFRHVFHSDLAKTHRLIAIDFPGHGDSSDANDPEDSYNQPAYAEACLQVIQSLSASKPLVVVGWSLGGHVAIEMAMRSTRIKGIMITGTPPIDKPEELDRAFTFGPTGWRDSVAARDELTSDELGVFAHGCADPPYEPWMLEAVVRTDGRARKLMFRHFAEEYDHPDPDEPSLKEHGGQKSFVENSDMPVAVINGVDEPFINLEFIRQIKFKNLWRDKCFEIEGCLHAPFWGKPKVYQELLESFIRDVS